MVLLRVAEHILTPEGERRLNETEVSGPAFDSLQDFLGSTVCNLIGQQESYFRVNGFQSVANLIALGRRNLNCFPGGPGSGPDLEVGPSSARDAFTGGQCTFNYTISAGSDVISSSGNEFVRTRGAQIDGPIYSVEINPASGLPGIWIRREAGGPLIAAGGATMSTTERNLNLSRGGFRDVTVTPTGGQSDDCGDSPRFPDEFPPGQDLPPAPNPGDVLIEREIRTREVVIDGNPVNFSYEVGPVTIDVDGFINIPIFNTLFRLTPTLEVEVDVGRSPSDGADTSEDITAIRDNLEQDIAGIVNGQACDGTPLVADVEGEGLAGLAQLITSASNLLATLTNSACPVGSTPPGLSTLILLESGTFQPGEVRLVDLPDDAVSVSLQVENLPSSLRVFKNAGMESEARYGFWSVQVESVEGGFGPEPSSVYTPSSRLEVPMFQGFQRRVRLSLQRGVQYTLYYQRIE